MEVAKLYVALAADASQYQQQLADVDRHATSWASDMGKRMGDALKLALLAAIAVIGVALGVFFKDSINLAADLESQMSGVAAVLGATAEEADLLKQAVIDLSLDPKLMVTTAQAADAMELLARNGLTVEQILGGAAHATVLLANATGADFATAADIATDAMALWNFEASQMGTVVDGITSVVLNSKFSIDDYRLALAQAGGVAAATGVEFADFNATIVAISSYFASGSDAGTSFKTMLQRLLPASGPAEEAMRELGLITDEAGNAFFTAEGEMKSMADVAGILHGALGPLSEAQRLQALSTIFGTDAMRAAAAMSQFTKDEFERLQSVMANTSAAEIAAQRMDNFRGSMEILGGVVEGLQLQIGNVLLPILQSLAIAGTNLLTAYGPPLIAAFEAFVGTLSDGGGLIDAFVAGMEALGASAEQVEQFRATAEAIGAFLDRLQAALAPIGQFIVSFVQWQDVVAGVAIVFTALLLPALLSFLAPIAGIIAAVAAVTLAIAALRTAFETNLGGVRDLALGLWAALQQAFDGIKALLAGDLPTAIANFRSAWETGWTAIVDFVRNLGQRIGEALQGLWQSITNWFNSVDWGALGRTLIEKFLAGMAALGQARADMWTWIMTSITNFIQSVDWGKLGYTLVDLLVKGIIGAVGLVAVGIAGFVTYIWNFITGTDWIGLGKNLVAAIVEGLMSFAEGAGRALASWRDTIFTWAGAEDWGGVGEKISQMVGDALAAGREFIGGKLTEWRDTIFAWAGAEDWQGVADTVSTKVADGLAAAKATISEKLTTWRDAIFDWAQAENWTEVAIVVASEVADGLGTESGRLSDQLASWRDALQEWADREDWIGVAASIAAGVADQLSAATGYISDRLDVWADEIAGWAEAEDWTVVAQSIAGLVAEELGNAASYIADQLVTWRDAIFDWAGAEDWAEVGTRIVELVNEGLTTFSNLVISTLIGWHTAFTDWVSSVDWYQIGYDLTYFITTGLLAWRDLIGDKIEEWRSQMSTEVERVDWRDVGEAIVERVLEIVGDIEGFLRETLPGWIAQFQAVTAGLTWEQVAAIILAAIALELRNLAAHIAGVADAWIADIKAEVSRVTGTLSEIGRSIVGGIAAGIAGAVDLIRGAFAGIGAAIQGGAAEAAQTQSPSRLTIPVGVDIAAGFAVGILQGAGMVVSAIGQLAQTTEVAGIMEFTAAIDGIVASIGPTLAALRMLLAVEIGGSDGLDALFAFVADIMSGLVSAFAVANELGEEALKEVKLFAETASKIVDLVGDALVVARQLGAVDFSAIAAGEHLLTQIGILAGIIQALVSAFADAAVEFGYLGDSVKAFAAGAESVLGLVEDGIYTAFLLAAVDFGPIVADWHLANQIVIFRNIIRTLVREFAEAADEFAYMSDAVQAFAEAAESVLGLVEEGLAAAFALAEVDFGPAVADWHLANQIVIFRNIIRTLVREFSEAADEFSYMSDAVQQFADAGAAVLGLVEDAIHTSFLLAEVDFGPIVADWHLANQIVIIRNIIRTLVREFAEAAAEFGVLSNEVLAFAKAAQAVIDLIRDALEVIGELANFAVVANLEANVQRFAADLVAIIAAIVAALEEAELLANEAVVQAGEMARALGNILDVVGDGVEAIAALSGYVATSGIESKARQFAADLAVVILAIVEGLRAAGILANEAVREAGEMARTLRDLLAIVGDGIEAIEALATYQGVEGLEAKVSKFADDLITVTTTLANSLAAAAASLGQDTIRAAVQFANDAQAIANAVDAALISLEKIANAPTPNIQPKMDYIVQSVQQIIAAAQTAGQVGQAVAGMTNFKNEIARMVNEVLGAIAELARLVAANTPGSVQDILNRIAAAFQAAQGQFSGAGGVLANAFISAYIGAPWPLVVNQVVSTVGDAIRAGQATAGGAHVIGAAFVVAMVAGLRGAGPQFVAAVIALVGDAIRAGQNAAGGATVVGRDLATAAIAGANSMRGALDAAGVATGNALLDGMARAISNGKSKVINAIIETIKSAIKAAQAELGIASPSKVFMRLARQAMEGLITVFGDPRDLLRSVGDMMSQVAQAAELTINVGAQTPTTLPQPAFTTPPPPPAAPMVAVRGDGGQVVNLYGDVVLEGVQDGRSLLEELKALGRGEA